MQVHSPPATATRGVVTIISNENTDQRGKTDKGKAIIEKKLGSAGAT